MPFSPQSLSVLARGGDFTLWRYQSADDPAALLAAGYFSPAAGILRRGDLISCVGAAAEQRTALLVADAGPGRVVLEPLQSLPPAALAALADVRVAEPTADEVLTFADGGWTNRPAAGRAGDAFAAAHAGAAGADAHAVATPACGRLHGRGGQAEARRHRGRRHRRSDRRRAGRSDRRRARHRRLAPGRLRLGRVPRQGPRLGPDRARRSDRRRRCQRRCQRTPNACYKRPRGRGPVHQPGAPSRRGPPRFPLGLQRHRRRHDDEGGDGGGY